MGSSVRRLSATGLAGGGAGALYGGRGAFLRPAVPLAVVAVGLFVFGIVITSKPATRSRTGSASADRAGGVSRAWSPRQSAMA